MKWLLNNCPRCQGDLFTDRDIDGWYIQCLQCGYRRDIEKADKVLPKAPKARAVRVL